MIIMIMCSQCKKNIAVVFTNKVVNGKQEIIGLCLPCAKKMGIAPLNNMLGLNDIKGEDYENLSHQMMDIIDNMDNLNAFSTLMGGVPAEDDSTENKAEESGFNNNPAGRANSKDSFNSEKRKRPRAKRKFLDAYGVNLTDKAQNNGIDRVVGRHREIDRVIQILNRRTKNNPILIGEAGVGKTAIAEGLAVRIAEKQVPLKLYDTQVYLLELTSVIADTQFRGQFEARMKGIIEEAREAKNVILIIDEVHNIIGAGSAENGAMNAANILKPALAKGELQVIGATTIDEYRKYIEKDSALERRFQPVFVEEPTVDETIEIIKGIRHYYENYHKVIISDEIIESAVKLSERYITDRFLPDKAIDVIDEAGSRANLKNQGLVELEALKEELRELRDEEAELALKNDYEMAAECKVHECKLEEKIKSFEKQYSEVKITLDDIASVIESWTKIPVQKITEIEAERLLNLEERLHTRVIGQNEAVTSLARTIRRNRSGFKKFKKPTSFIFVGPTGVGKTELVRALACELFGSEKALIRIDMSEYMEKHTVSKLIGAPPGYIGFDQGGQLTEKVRRNPYSVILLDEIEKAHPDVFNLLLQILEDGRLTDNQGRTVHFENTVLIMTSNAGTSLKGNGIGFSKDNYASLANKINNVLKETFRPEFLNRVDETIIFTKLSKDELRKIVDLMLKEILAEAMDKNISVEITDNAKGFLLEKGYDEKYGARPLRRAIQKYIEDELAELYIKGVFKEGSCIKIDVKDDKLIFE